MRIPFSDRLSIAGKVYGLLGASVLIAGPSRARAAHTAEPAFAVPLDDMTGSGSSCDVPEAAPGV